MRWAVRKTPCAIPSTELSKRMAKKPGPYWVPGFFVRLQTYFTPEGIFMIRFLTWLRSILMAVVNGLAKVVVLVVLVVAILLVFSLARGDGMPGNMVLALDLREPIDDSAASP